MNITVLLNLGFSSSPTPGTAREPEAFFEMPEPGANDAELVTRAWGPADMA